MSGGSPAGESPSGQQPRRMGNKPRTGTEDVRQREQRAVWARLGLHVRAATNPRRIAAALRSARGFGTWLQPRGLRPCRRGPGRVSVRFAKLRFRVCAGVAGQWFAGGDTVGMQPPAKAEGKTVGEGEGARVERRCLESCPDKKCGTGDGLGAPAARWEDIRGWGRGVFNRLVAALRAAPARLCLGAGFGSFRKIAFPVFGRFCGAMVCRGGGGTVGMQPPPKGGGKPGAKAEGKSEGKVGGKAVGVGEGKSGWKGGGESGEGVRLRRRGRVVCEASSRWRSRCSHSMRRARSYWRRNITS